MIIMMIMKRGSKNYEMFFGLELGENKRFSSIKESERSSGSSFCSFCWAQGSRGWDGKKPKKKKKEGNSMFLGNSKN